MQLDSSGNNYIEVFETASGGFQMYLHAISAGGQVYSQFTPIAYAGANGNDAVRVDGRVRPDVSPGEAVLGLGALIAGVGVGLIGLAAVVPILGASAAAAGIALILDGAALTWSSQYITDGTVTEDWGMDDDYYDFGSGGGGYDDPGIDEDVF